MNVRDLKLKRYIGDGVYAGYEPDSDNVWLWTSNGVSDSNMIAFEAPVRVAVSTYFRDFIQHRSDQPIPEEL
jgi:hypothetical protein